jgi:hypothetical protein
LQNTVTLTLEQAAPINSSSRKLKVFALAGTGKSTLLRAFSFFNPQLKILYIVFNSDNAEQAKKSFPSTNVDVSTCHGLAFRALGFQYKNANKLGPITVKALNQHLQLNDWQLCSIVNKTLNKFIFSEESTITVNHLPDDISFLYSQSHELIVKLAQTAWSKVTDLSSSMPCSHDAYFKIWALNNPTLNYDVIMFDEAQDSNNIIMSVLERQNARFIVVGDRNQQIYLFRESINSLNHPFLADAEEFPLTQSFRFGQGVAKVANIILYLLGESLRVRGMDSIDSKIMTGDDDEPGHHGAPYQKAFINRTVFGTIESALALIDKGHKIYWAGKIKNYKLDELRDLYHFSLSQTDMIKSRYITKEYTDFNEYKAIAEQTADAEMNRSIKLILNYGARLPALIDRLEATATDHQSEAAFVVSTAHRSKGLEFESVSLGEDFKNPFLMLEDAMKRNNGRVPEQVKLRFQEEMNLLYVAITRAIYRLNLNTAVKDLVEIAKSKMAQPKKTG